MAHLQSKTIKLSAAEKLNLVFHQKVETCSVIKELGFSKEYNSPIYQLNNGETMVASHSHPNITKIEIVKEDKDQIEIFNGKAFCNALVTFEGLQPELNGTIRVDRFAFKVCDVLNTEDLAA